MTIYDAGKSAMGPWWTNSCSPWCPSKGLFWLLQPESLYVEVIWTSHFLLLIKQVLNQNKSNRSQQTSLETLSYLEVRAGVPPPHVPTCPHQTFIELTGTFVLCWESPDFGALLAEGRAKSCKFFSPLSCTCQQGWKSKSVQAKSFCCRQPAPVTGSGTFL